MIISGKSYQGAFREWKLHDIHIKQERNLRGKRLWPTAGHRGCQGIVGNSRSQMPQLALIWAIHKSIHAGRSVEMQPCTKFWTWAEDKYSRIYNVPLPSSSRQTHAKITPWQSQKVISNVDGIKPRKERCEHWLAWRTGKKTRRGLLNGSLFLSPSYSDT